MTLFAHKGRCPRCGNDPQGDAEFLAELARSRQPATAVPAGWKLVPAEPTEAMFTAFGRNIEEGVVYVGGFVNAYRIMLAAAPPAPTAQAASLVQSVEKIAAAVCREVAELPDRNSPVDWPEAMLVTHDELHAIVVAVLASKETQL